MGMSNPVADRDTLCQTYMQGGNHPKLPGIACEIDCTSSHLLRKGRPNEHPISSHNTLNAISQPDQTLTEPLAPHTQRNVQPFSYSRFRKFQSRVWTNLKLAGGHYDFDMISFEIETLKY